MRPFFPFAAVLVVTILTACRPAPSPTIVLDAALMPLVPADTTILGSIRLSELKKTEVYRQAEASGKLGPLEEFARKTGLDLRKEIWEIVVASNGRSSVALVRGKFTDGGIAGAGLEPDLQREGLRKFPYRGYTLQGDQRIAVAFLNTSVAVAGPTVAVQQIIDARDGSKGAPPAELLDRARWIPSSHQIWVVSRQPVNGKLPDALGSILGGLRSMPIAIEESMAALEASTGLRFLAEAKTQSPEMALKLSTGLRGASALAKLAGSAEIREIASSLAVETESDRVRVKGILPPAFLTNLPDFLPAEPGQAPAQ